MTNREMINKMSDKELAEYTRNNFLWFCGECKLNSLCDHYSRNGDDCIKAIEKWLKLEADE